MEGLFDSHAHLQHAQFNRDRNRVIDNAVASGVSHIVNVGYDLESSRQAIELSNEYDFMFAAVGIHPHDASKLDSSSLKELEEMTNHEMVVALGEVGLDYYRDLSPRDVQKRAFREQLDLVGSSNLPVIVHVRKAYGDAIEILRAWGRGNGVMHCFSGSADEARMLLSLGFKLGFTGSVTFGSGRLESVAKNSSETDILIETDCPYLVPKPMKGRNEPRNLHLICEKIARTRGISPEVCARITASNAKSLFRV
jgi:TatD DNase family protein